MRTVLTIAGSDSSGGAGVEADIKTITMHGAYAMTAITALTAQNTMGVRGICETSPSFLGKQLDTVFEDIFPDAVKIGMVSSEKHIYVIAERLAHFHAKNIVVDPVMVATSGHSLMKKETIGALCEVLLPLSSRITPNIPEAETLTGLRIHSAADMEKAAEKMGNLFGTVVLVKGGHRMQDANDFLYENGNGKWLRGSRVDTKNTHGTGCTLSSAIASNLAKGYPITEAVKRAKKYIIGALRAEPGLGKGAGPMQHSFDLVSEFAK